MKQIKAILLSWYTASFKETIVQFCSSWVLGPEISMNWNGQSRFVKREIASTRMRLHAGWQNFCLQAYLYDWRSIYSEDCFGIASDFWDIADNASVFDAEW